MTLGSTRSTEGHPRDRNGGFSIHSIGDPLIPSVNMRHAASSASDSARMAAFMPPLVLLRVPPSTTLHQADRLQESPQRPSDQPSARTSRSAQTCEQLQFPRDAHGIGPGDK